MTAALKRVPSEYCHPLYELVEGTGSYSTNEMIEKGNTDAPKFGANLVSSQIVDENDKHTVMLDIDLPAYLIPSSTEGHYHLYIDTPMPWRKYKRLLKELARAGIIETGYYKASVRRKHTALRMRGVKKPAPTPGRVVKY